MFLFLGAVIWMSRSDKLKQMRRRVMCISCGCVTIGATCVMYDSEVYLWVGCTFLAALMCMTLGFACGVYISDGQPVLHVKKEVAVTAEIFIAKHGEKWHCDELQTPTISWAQSF